MKPINITEALVVGAAPEAVIISSTEACDEEGADIPVEAFLILEPAVAVKLAHAILQAVENLPEEDFSDVPAELL